MGRAYAAEAGGAPCPLFDCDGIPLLLRMAWTARPTRHTITERALGTAQADLGHQGKGVIDMEYTCTRCGSKNVMVHSHKEDSWSIDCMDCGELLGED